MEKDQKLVDLEQKPMGRLLAQYSLPAIVGMAAMSFYNIVDSIYIGQCCGAYAITAMGLLFPIMNLLVALGTLVGLGGAATTSITLGQQDFPRAFRVLGHCTIMGVALGIIIGWLPLPWMDELLYLFGADENTVGPAREFMLVLMLTCPLTFSFMNLNHVMRASGYPYKAMYSLLFSMVVNIGCAHLFVYVLEWGMTGAALATTAGQAVGMVWVLLHFLNRRSVIYFRGRMWKLCGPIMRRICLLGLPPCLMNLCGCLVVIVFNTQFLRYEGPMGVGAYSIVNRVLLGVAMVVLGIAQGMQPIAGYNLGIGFYSRVRKVFYYAVFSAFFLTLACWVGIQMFPEAVVRAFVKETDANSTQLIALSTQGLRIMGLVFPLVGTQIIIGNFFQSIGRPIMSVFLNIMRQFLVLIPSLLLLPLWLGGKGIWFSQMVADTVCALLSYLVIYIFFKRVFHKHDTPTTDMSIERIPLLIATRNAHKAREFARILPPQYELKTLADFPGAPDPEETGTTFEANAAIKAESISAVFPGLVVSDDSGICVDALGGMPGVYSARYAGTHGDDEGNNRKMLTELGALPESAMPFTARYVCAISVARGGKELGCFVGTVEGQITLNPRGTGGFGYDPLFIPEGYDCTMAEISAEEKNSISHRGEALRKFEAWLRETQLA